MTNNKTGKKTWLWLLPVAAILIAAVIFGLSLPRAASAPAEPTVTPPPAEEVHAPLLSPGYFPTDGTLFTPEAPFTRGMAGVRAHNCAAVFDGLVIRPLTD